MNYNFTKVLEKDEEKISWRYRFYLDANLELSNDILETVMKARYLTFMDQTTRNKIKMNEPIFYYKAPYSIDITDPLDTTMSLTKFEYLFFQY